jgi:predicted RNase H-like nuclease (RuvC/YqgF family)
MNDIKFLEKYNESAIDNFVAVVKQNILFQAQVAYLSEQLAHTEELRKQIAEFEPVKEALVKLRDDNINLTNELNSKVTIIESANKSDAEKYRLQTSLNEQSREIERLTTATVSLQEQVKEQTEYIAKLEEMLPKSAKKKLGITQEQNIEETIQEESVDNENVKTLSSGGSF